MTQSSSNTNGRSRDGGGWRDIKCAGILRMTGPGGVVESVRTARAKKRVSSEQCEIAGRYESQRGRSNDTKSVNPKESGAKSAG